MENDIQSTNVEDSDGSSRVFIIAIIVIVIVILLSVIIVAIILYMMYYGSSYNCTGNGDCPSGYRCSGGKCVPNSCNNRNHCGPGQVCRDGQCVDRRCVSDSGCGAGNICENGSCVPARCSSTNPCGQGLVCQNGRCVSESPSSRESAGGCSSCANSAAKIPPPIPAQNYQASPLDRYPPNPIDFNEEVRMDTDPASICDSGMEMTEYGEYQQPSSRESIYPDRNYGVMNQSYEEVDDYDSFTSNNNYCRNSSAYSEYSNCGDRDDSCDRDIDVGTSCDDRSDDGSPTQYRYAPDELTSYSNCSESSGSGCNNDEYTEYPNGSESSSSSDEYSNDLTQPRTECDNDEYSECPNECSDSCDVTNYSNCSDEYEYSNELTQPGIEYDDYGEQRRVSWNPLVGCNDCTIQALRPSENIQSSGSSTDLINPINSFFIQSGLLYVLDDGRIYSPVTRRFVSPLHRIPCQLTGFRNMLVAIRDSKLVARVNNQPGDLLPYLNILGVEHISSTQDGRNLWIQLSNGIGYLYNSQLVVIDQKMLNPSTIIKYGRDVNVYGSLDRITNTLTMSNGDTYMNVKDFVIAPDDTVKILTISESIGVNDSLQAIGCGCSTNSDIRIILVRNQEGEYEGLRVNDYRCEIS
jgi:hypothetical protein